jgi:hypothetical protein
MSFKFILSKVTFNPEVSLLLFGLNDLLLIKDGVLKLPTIIVLESI